LDILGACAAMGKLCCIHDPKLAGFLHEDFPTVACGAQIARPASMLQIHLPVGGIGVLLPSIINGHPTMGPKNGSGPMAKAWHDFNAEPLSGETLSYARWDRELGGLEHHHNKAPDSNLRDWRKKISDHIAYGLLVYTGLQIFLTIAALRQESTSLLPYLALVILVGAIIPACRMVERRWTCLSESEARDPAREMAYRRDRMMVWMAAIGMPFALSGLFRVLAMVFG
jgi:hypothetical protein